MTVCFVAVLKCLSRFFFRVNVPSQPSTGHSSSAGTGGGAVLGPLLPRLGFGRTSRGRFETWADAVEPGDGDDGYASGVTTLRTHGEAVSMVLRADEPIESSANDREDE